MPAPHSTFWDDLAEDLQDPEFASEYIRQTIRIATIDRVVQGLDDAREAAGLSKAALARAINQDPATVRRLFSSHQANPTLGTLSELAAALGMQITLAPFPAKTRDKLTVPLLDKKVADTDALAKYLTEVRSRPAVLA